jgi:hypothetical protein
LEISFSAFQYRVDSKYDADLKNRNRSCWHCHHWHFHDDISDAAEGQSFIIGSFGLLLSGFFTPDFPAV